MNEITYPPGCKDIQVELANDELIRRLKKIQTAFQNLDQQSADEYKELARYLGCDIFLEHEHDDVQLLVACCLADIFRVYAPDSPYQDPANLKKIFLFLANQLRGLKENANTSFKRYFYLLENLEYVKTFQLAMELDDCQEIIATLFDVVFKIVNDKTPPKVQTLLFELLHPLLNESDQISARLLDNLFTRIIEPQKSNNKEAYNLAVNLLKKGNEHFEFLVQNHLNNILHTSRNNMSNNLTITAGAANQTLNHSHNASANSSDSDILNSSINNILGQSSEMAAAAGVHGSSNQFISDKLCLIIYELYKIRYGLLELVMPQLEYKLKSSDLKERREYTKLLSKLFGEKDSKLAIQLPQLWEAYLERFNDLNEDIRKICVVYLSVFLVNYSAMSSSGNSSTGAGASGTNTSALVSSSSNSYSQALEAIIEQVKNRALDAEESLRIEVVQEILKAMRLDSGLIRIELLNILKERTLDIKIKIRKLALQGLAGIYKKIHSKSSNRQSVQNVNWIPSKIMRIYFQDSNEDKLVVERLLNSSIVPYSLGPREKMAQLYYAFSTFDEYSILSLIEIMRNRVILYQLMKSILDAVEVGTKTPAAESKLNQDMILVSQHLLDTTKGHELMKTLVNLFNTNINLRNYFKNFVNLTCSAARSLHYIQLILSNLSSLNQTQMAMARRLIERMSSLIIDKECVECLIELIEHKIKQKLTPKQRRMINKRKRKSAETANKSKNNRKGKKGGKSKNDHDSDNSEFDDDDASYDEDDDDFNDDDFYNKDRDDQEASNDKINDDVDMDDENEDENDDNTTKTTENSRDDSENDRQLVRHIDDDGEKGIKLLKIIFSIHGNYGFNNTITYQKLLSFITSRKDHIVSLAMKLLSMNYANVRETYNAEQIESFDKINNQYLDKLKHFCKYGKPKQAKYSVHLIHSAFEKPKNEEILTDLFKDLLEEANLKQGKTFITTLVSLGHICYLIPGQVSKDLKEFISKVLVKEILLQPANKLLDISNNESLNSSSRLKNNLKLAGKWCQNEEELPYNTRARIESVKLIVRWCLGLKSECNNILFTLKFLVKLIKENSTDTTVDKKSLDESDSKSSIVVSEAERSRFRCVCGSQLIKLCQEPSFRLLLTADYFHALARLIIDPVTNVRDLIIGKLQKALKSNKIPFFYMGIFALVGLDTNRERKARVKKIFSALIKNIKLSDSKDQSKNRLLPEKCLPYAISLLAHNIQIDSLKDESKVKQIKECMSIILDPLLESPDGHQLAYIKKMLGNIKMSDDGLATALIASSSKSDGVAVSNQNALKNLYFYNRNICFICEVFLFHMHSKLSSFITAKEYDFEIKLPSGFYATRENGSDNNQHEQIAKEVVEHLKETTTEINTEIVEETDTVTVTKDKVEKEKVQKKVVSSITIIPRKRKAVDEPATEKAKTPPPEPKPKDAPETVKEILKESKKSDDKDTTNEEVDSEDEDVSLGDLIKAKKKNSIESTKSISPPQGPVAKRSRTNLTDSNQQKEAQEEEEKRPTRKSTRARNSITPSYTVSTRGKKNTKNDEDKEENEKENEISKEIDKSKAKNEEKDKKAESEDEEKEEKSESEEDDAKEEEKSTKTRRKTAGAKATAKKPAAKSSNKKEDLDQSASTPVNTSTYSLRQKRATTAKK